MANGNVQAKNPVGSGTRHPVGPESSFPLDYALARHWAAFPGRSDAADFLPAGSGEADGQASATVDTFYIHPTTCLDESCRNAAVDESEAAELVERLALPFQASVFNGVTRVFAPRYRQASLGAFMDRSGAGERALAQAWQDVRAAFQLYLTRYRGRRPFIIAGHSQGTALAIRLLREFVIGQPLQADLVAAYLPGQFVGRDTLPGLPFLDRPEMVGGWVSWATVASGATPHLVCGWSAYEDFPSFTINTDFPLVINPLTWDAGRPAVVAGPNPGALPDGGVLGPTPGPLVAEPLDVRCIDALVEIGTPRLPWYEKAFHGSDGDFHVGDYALFWLSLRRNVAARVKSFPKDRSTTLFRGSAREEGSERPSCPDFGR